MSYIPLCRSRDVLLQESGGWNIEYGPNGLFVILANVRHCFGVVILRLLMQFSGDVCAG